MYSLRTITKNGIQFNTALGSSYTLLRDSDLPGEGDAFKEVIKSRYDGMEKLGKVENNLKYDCYALVWSEQTGYIDLFTGSEYYIVMSNGQTYANLTKR